MGLFRDPFISIGPLAQERCINLLKKFYKQENPNAPVDKERRFIFMKRFYSRFGQLKLFLKNIYSVSVRFPVLYVAS